MTIPKSGLSKLMSTFIWAFQFIFRKSFSNFGQCLGSLGCFSINNYRFSCYGEVVFRFSSESNMGHIIFNIKARFQYLYWDRITSQRNMVVDHDIRWKKYYSLFFLLFRYSTVFTMIRLLNHVFQSSLEAKSSAVEVYLKLDIFLGVLTS